MTVFDNVAFPFRVRGQRKAAGPAVERALALVDLAGFGPRPATQLSGGQQQRVALARAIAFGVKVILFDEPLSNLDAQLRLQMRTELAELRRLLGFTAVYVTHDQDEAFSLSDRIVVMRGGRVEQQGTPSSLHAAPRTRFAAAFLGVRNILDAEVAGSRARLMDGTVLPLACAVPPGPVSVAFRPTAVQFGEGNPARIARILFVGDLLHVFLRSGPIEICAYARPQSGLAEGETVLWRVAPEDCLVLCQ
jgi:ABC-type Fe3+/spermidine/putrescine transport system ATPase subunit